MKTQSKSGREAPPEEKIDKAIEKTFPASDPPATGKPTSTEPSKRPKDRHPPVISKEEIEHARQGKGHTQNDSIKR